MKGYAHSTFSNCTSLESVSSFPYVIELSGTFSNCYSLKSVDFPNATAVYDSAFYNCTNLSSVSFPKASRVGGNTFSQCTNLTTVSFPSVTELRNYAFDGCTNLQTLEIGPDIRSISYDICHNCPNLTVVCFTGISVPANLKSSFGNENTVYYRSADCPDFDWKEFTGKTGVYPDD